MKPIRVFPLVCLTAAICLGGTAGASQSGEVLVLGDSVPFAFIASAGHEYINPLNFHGLADDLGGLLNFHSVDAACPGETTGSFLSSTAPDNGCRAYRAAFPLHVAYGSSQLAFARQYLQQHSDVQLVTITLGANDAFLLEASCASAANPGDCIDAGLPALLATVASNMETILADVRGTGYGGVIVVTNYYSLDYSDPVGTGLTALLNKAIEAPTPAFGAVVANVFTAFKTVSTSAAFGGKTCNAGLLNASVQDQLLCDVHPSQSGHLLIAQTISRAFLRNSGT
jgi:lysophospholipase L1-like esterase